MAELGFAALVRLTPEALAAAQRQAIETRLRRSEYRGAYRAGRKWMGVVRVGGARVYLGLFDTQTQALAACRAERRRRLYDMLACLRGDGRVR